MLNLKQLVPSETCLKCDGCCRYKEKESIWRPKLGADDKKKLAAMITLSDEMDSQGYLRTKESCQNHPCRFLNEGKNTCAVYAHRPFECLLYPFIISQSGNTVKIYAHLSCPYIQDHLPFTGFENYVQYLKEFFSKDEVREFLIRNKAMLHDYSSLSDELLYLFEI